MAMKSCWRTWLVVCLALLLLSITLAFWASPLRVQAAIPSQAASGSGAPFDVQPGNYCIGCHSTDDPVLHKAIDWRGGVQMQAANPCPAVNTIEEQLFYTGRLMQAIRTLREQLPDNAAALALDTRFAAAEQSYARLLDMPVTSLDAFISEAQSQRYQMGKIYTGLNDLHEAVAMQRILIWSAVVSAILLGSLAWGYRNTLRFAPGGRFTLGGRMGAWLKPGLLVLLIFLLFALPIFREFPAPLEVASAEEQEKQATLDESSRAASAADRALGRAWMLSRVSAAWASSDPARSQEIFEAALNASEEAQMEAAALWGDMQLAGEAAAGSAVDQEKAALIAASLQAVRSRAWSLRMMAEDWLPLDALRGRDLLEQAAATAESGTGIYRDLDLRAIAVSFSTVDEARSLQILAQIDDPFVRAWGYREAAAMTGNQELLDQAQLAAALVEDVTLRSYAFVQIAALSPEASAWDAAYRNLESLEGAGRAYSLARLSAASGDGKWAELIDPAYPAAVAWARYHLDDFPAAWQASAQISDPLERADAQAAIAGAWGSAEMAREISIPFYRERSLGFVIQMSGDVTLAQEIQNGYDRAVALSAVGAHGEALAVEGLRDAYPLVALGVAMAQENPAQVQTILERLQREADKSVVLNALVEAGSDPALFSQALDFALAARRRGDALAPVAASLELAEAVSAPDLKVRALEQALQAAERIAIK